MTLGQKRVRTSFNPSADHGVEVMKQKFADVIDQLESFKNGIKASGPEGETPEAFNLRCGEAMRQIAIAQTEAEGAAHWAVKAITSVI